VVYRPIRDARPVEVRLAWWADSPPPELDAFSRLVREEYTDEARRHGRQR
jgi:hypothetical protein